MRLHLKHLEQLEEITEPVDLDWIAAPWFTGLGKKSIGEKLAITFEDGKIGKISDGGYGDINEEPVLFPGGVDMHVHGREAFGHPLSPKEDAYTLSLALAQGGAVTAIHMPNVPLLVTNSSSYKNQVKSLNEKREERPKPIIPFGAYAIVLSGSAPFADDIMYKLMWNTYSPPGTQSNFTSDDAVFDTLTNYSGQWITAHLETIADIDENKIRHPDKRPISAANRALEIALKANDYLIKNGKAPFHLHIAHVSTPEQVLLAHSFNELNCETKDFRGKYRPHVTVEVTPQTLTTNYDDFSTQTGLDEKFGQQNPPIPHTREIMNRLRHLTSLGKIEMFATDHAPHLVSEKERGMSGMPQAATSGQLYLNLVSQGLITYQDFVRMRSTAPSIVLEEMLGMKTGRAIQGYDASFTIISDKPSNITNADVLSKCGWTPWNNIPFSHTVHGIISQGTLYTNAALKKLHDAYVRK